METSRQRGEDHDEARRVAGNDFPLHLGFGECRDMSKGSFAGLDQFAGCVGPCLASNIKLNSAG